jgi:hypothetical protein
MNSRRSLPLVWTLFGFVLVGLAFAGAPPETHNWFAWVPSYPGAQVVASRTIQNGDQLTYKCEFHVKDNGATVRNFYEKKLRAAGFKIIGKGGITRNSWDLYGESPDGTRTIDLGGDAQSEGVNVRVTARRALASTH